MQALRVVVLMGVSGSGKTSVGEALTRQGVAHFEDADGYHPPENIAKMSRGEPLDDADRQAWLERLRARIEERLRAAETFPLALACSALRRAYRDHLRRPGEPVGFVYLRGSFETISARLKARTEHFFPESLLRSQFETLEEPGTDEAGILTLEVDAHPPQWLAAQVSLWLGSARQ